MSKYLYIKSNIAKGLIIAFLLNSLGPVPVQAGEFYLPTPGTMVRLSPQFNPPILKGIKVHPENPFKFEFILDQGSMSSPKVSTHGRESRDSGVGDLKQESTKLIKYFLASLTIPEKDLWVNLSPYEKNRILSNSFGLTEMGRDLLAEDYMLKQITASLIYPEDEVGRRFWKRIYAEAQKKFGTTNIPVNTFNKVWIIPEKAIVYENAKAGTAYLVESKLKVMLEQDYLAMQKGTDSNSAVRPILGQELVSVSHHDVNALGSQIVREIVIPELTKEVNQGQNFAQLRQVYNSFILAAWYKKKIKESILAQVYANKNKVNGLSFPPTEAWGQANAFVGNPQQIYQRYLQAFKKGVYNYIKEEADPTSGQVVPRKYFSGGVELLWNAAMTTTTDDSFMADPLSKQIMKINANFTPIYDEAMSSSMDIGYEEARMWRDRKLKGEIKSFPIGFWNSKQMARNFIYLALDSIEGFREARHKNDIKTMAILYRQFVIGYKAKVPQKYQSGQLGFFQEFAGLKGLMGNPREFLIKKDSPGALLRFALPGLIDLRNPDALDPLEVEHSYWTDSENAKYHIYEALDAIEGFKKARENNDIKTMAELYRKYVIGYKAHDNQKYYNSQLGFFYELGGLGGLMSNPSKFLAKKSSPASVLRFALPGLIDLRNPDALNPLEVESNYWTDQANAKYHIYQALDTIEGFKEAREKNDIKAMADLYRQFVIKYKVKNNIIHRDGQVGFFEEVGGLSGLMRGYKDFLLKLSSPASLLRFALPGLIDLQNPDALNPLEVELNYWTDPVNALYHIYQALDTIEGFKEAREKNDIKVMADLYRKFVIDYIPKNKEKYSRGQLAFFKEVGGLAGLMATPRKFLEKTDSAASLLRFALPGLIDLKNPDALNPLEVELDYWTDPESARFHIYEALDTIEGFKVARENNDIKTMADLYRKNVIGYKTKKPDKYSDGQQAFFYEVGGISGLMTVPREYLDMRGSPSALLRFALPGLIDLKNPLALDSLEVERTYWSDPENAKRHIFQALDTIEGFKEARENHDIKTMAKLYRVHVIGYKVKDKNKYSDGQQGFFYEVGGLIGLMHAPRVYLDKRGSPAALLKFALPNLVDQNNPDALRLEEISRINGDEAMASVVDIGYEEAKMWRDKKLRDRTMKFPKGFWTEAMARNFIYLALDSIEGFQEARHKNDMKTMANLYRKFVIGYKVRNANKFVDGQQGFFYEVGLLKGLMSHPSMFLKKTGSAASLLRFALPGLIDLRNPNALDPLEVEHNYWDDPNNARYHLYLAVDSIEGFKAARESGDVKEMAKLYREFILDYKVKNIEKYYNSQIGFFTEVGGLAGLMARKRKFLDKTDSPAALIRFALPELIDLNNPDALQPLEIEKNYWSNPANIKYHAYKALDTIEGFQGARENNDVKTMAELYRQFVIKYRVHNREKYQDGQQGFFYELGGLGSVMVNNYNDYFDKLGSAAALLRFALPNLVDQNNPDALRTKEIEYSDNSMASSNSEYKDGGIDLTSDKALQTQSEGMGIQFHINPAMLAQLKNTIGFVPVITGMQPMTNLREFLTT